MISHSRILPALPSTSVVDVPITPRSRRSRVRGWLFWALAISLLIHLLVLLFLLWNPNFNREDESRAEAPVEWQIQTEPNKETAAPPPSTPATNQPPNLAPPQVDKSLTQQQPPKPEETPPPPEAAPQPIQPVPIAPPPPVLTSPNATELVPEPAKPIPVEAKPTQPKEAASKPAPKPSPKPSPFANMQHSNDFFTPRAAPPPPTERVPNDARHGGVNLALGKIERYDQAPASRHQNDVDADVQVSGAEVGEDWMNKLHGWWIDHRRYPSEAVANYEDGDVTIRFDVAKNGLTSQAEVIHSSKSTWLDAAAVGTFSHAHLPPLPPTTPEDHATITITIRYILY